MSFAQGLLLAYLKVSVLAAAINAVIAGIGWLSVRLHGWEERSSGGDKPTADPDRKTGE